VKNRQHFDLAYDDTEEAIVRLEGLGARRLGEPYEQYGWWWQVMADPESNEFCVVKELSSS
jgi:predicted enzyme related to lactoylglutathione lyase